MPDLFGFGSVEVFAKTDPTELRRNAPLPAAPAVFRNSRRLKKLFLVPESFIPSVAGVWWTFFFDVT